MHDQTNETSNRWKSDVTGSQGTIKAKRELVLKMYKIEAEAKRLLIQETNYALSCIFKSTVLNYVAGI